MITGSFKREVIRILVLILLPRKFAFSNVTKDFNGLVWNVKTGNELADLKAALLIPSWHPNSHAWKRRTKIVHKWCNFENIIFQINYINSRNRNLVIFGLGAPDQTHSVNASVDDEN